MEQNTIEVELVNKYPHIPSEFIGRLMEACEEAGYPVHLAEQRYLAKDTTVPKDEHLEAVFKSLH